GSPGAARWLPITRCQSKPLRAGKSPATSCAPTSSATRRLFRANPKLHDIGLVPSGISLFFRPKRIGKERSEMATIGTNQTELRLAFGVHNAAKGAPAKVLRQIESEAQALAVSMMAGGHKLASIAAAIGKSEGYVSRMR